MHLPFSHYVVLCHSRLFYEEFIKHLYIRIILSHQHNNVPKYPKRIIKYGLSAGESYAISKMTFENRLIYVLWYLLRSLHPRLYLRIVSFMIVAFDRYIQDYIWESFHLCFMIVAFDRYIQDYIWESFHLCFMIVAFDRYIQGYIWESFHLCFMRSLHPRLYLRIVSFMFYDSCIRPLHPRLYLRIVSFMFYDSCIRSLHPRLYSRIVSFMFYDGCIRSSHLHWMREHLYQQKLSKPALSLDHGYICIKPWAVNTCDDVIKWKNCQRYWPFVWGIHRSPVNSPHKGQCHGALMFSLICAWINDWVYNREAGDLRRHSDHDDVIVMASPHNINGGLAKPPVKSHAWVIAS